MDFHSNVEGKIRAFSTIQVFIISLSTEHRRLCFVLTSSAVVWGSYNIDPRRWFISFLSFIGAFNLDIICFAHFRELYHLRTRMLAPWTGVSEVDIFPTY